MYETDILVILYPNAREVEQVLIIDPFDKKVEYYSADSLEEVKQLLKENLPFCSQGHPEVLHLGVAYITEWGSLRENNIILYPNKNEVKSIIIVDPNNNKVESYRVDSIEEAKEILKDRLQSYIEWESIPETEIIIKKPSDIESLGDKQ